MSEIVSWPAWVIFLVSIIGIGALMFLLRAALRHWVPSDEREHLASKPAPDVFRVGAERIGVDPTAAVAVEDATSGVALAHVALADYAAVAAVLAPALVELAPLENVPGKADLLRTMSETLTRARTALSEPAAAGGRAVAHQRVHALPGGGR